MNHLLRWGIPLALLTAGALLPGCGKAPPGAEPSAPPWFEDVTSAAGLDFVHDAGPVDEAKPFMPQIVGSGAAVFDFDGDGLLDLYLLNNGGQNGRTNRLFKQLRGGTFKDVSAGSGLDFAGYNMGVAVADVNNDGRPDVLVTQYRGVKLFLNNGDGTFTDVTKESGLDNPHWATSAAFLDYNRDGWLDLVVVNYVDYDSSLPCASLGGVPDYCPPNQFGGTVTRLFRNKGTAGDGRGVPHFEDVTLASGLGRAPGPGLGVACADFDGEGWPDIFVANDGQPNRLWINHHDGTFKDEAVARGLACNELGQSQANMGVALGDVYGDGLFDLFATHLGEEGNTLWRQGPRGLFHDATASSRVTHAGWRGAGWGAALADFDNDGALDLALVNGRVSRGKAAADGLGPHWSRYAERNQLFAGRGDGSFEDISHSNKAFCGAAGVYRALVVADFDDDGGLDLLAGAVDGSTRLYRNKAPRRGHWLTVRAVDPVRKRDAYGAEIAVQAGGRRWVSAINPGQGFLCSQDPRAHFGLGAAKSVDAIEVLWPDGEREVFDGRPADQTTTLVKGQGRALEK